MLTENMQSLKIKNQLRESVKTLADKIVGRGRFQKKATVALCNIKALFDFRKASDSIFDYREIIAGKRSFYLRENYRANGFYGIGMAIKRYSGYNKKINACIEHGMYWGDYCLEFEAKNSGLNGILTFGEGRYDVLKNSADVPIHMIGPYIYYAENLLNEEQINKIKKAWGKVLLVFPTHSVENFQEDFDVPLFLKWIDEFKQIHHFNTVVVCIYYKDILLGRDEEYIKKGYKVVTAGYLYDPHFLDRLNTFIEISDFAVSNSVGTHLCYCVAKEKGYVIFDQEITLNAYVKDAIIEYPKDSTGKLIKELKILFSQYHEKPTKEQVKIINYWCGLEQKKTRKELFEILKSLE